MDASAEIGHRRALGEMGLPATPIECTLVAVGQAGAAVGGAAEGRLLMQDTQEAAAVLDKPAELQNINKFSAKPLSNST
jgi:hypothetical protein